LQICPDQQRVEAISRLLQGVTQGWPMCSLC
jgi:hypothetical protein